MGSNFFVEFIDKKKNEKYDKYNKSYFKGVII